MTLRRHYMRAVCLCDMVSAAVTATVQWRVRSSMIPTSVLLSVYLTEREGSAKSGAI